MAKYTVKRIGAETKMVNGKTYKVTNGRRYWAVVNETGEIAFDRYGMTMVFDGSEWAQSNANRMNLEAK